MKKTSVVLPIRSITFILVFILISLIQKKQLEDITSYWSIIASGINIIMILVMVLIFSKKQINYFDYMGLNQDKKSVKKNIIQVVVFILIGVGGMYLSGLICYQKFPYMAPMLIAPIAPALAIINIFLLPITTTIAEDTIYLGLGTKSFNRKILNILIPAFFYALQHAFIPTIFNVQYMLYRFLSFLPLTIFISFMYVKNNSIKAFMIGHFLINLLTVMQILFTSCIPGFYASML